MPECSGGVPFEPARLVAELAGALGGEVDEAARSIGVDRVVSPADARRPTDLVVVTSPRAVAAATRSPGVLLCEASLGPRFPPERRWVHKHPWWVVAELLGTASADTAGQSARDGGVDPVAVHPTARIGIGAVVHAGATIGPGCDIGAYAIVFPRVRLGVRVVVGCHSVIGSPGFGWAFGPDGSSVRIPQLGGVLIEDGAEIGPMCTVDAGTLGPTRLGEYSKLDAHVHVGHNVKIGARTLVAAQVGFAGSCEIGDDVMIGGQAGIADHVRVGNRARIAAKSGVIGDVPEGAVVAGFPAVSRFRWLRAMARLLESRSR